MEVIDDPLGPYIEATYDGATVGGPWFDWPEGFTMPANGYTVSTTVKFLDSSHSPSSFLIYNGVLAGPTTYLAEADFRFTFAGGDFSVYGSDDSLNAETLAYDEWYTFQVNMYKGTDGNLWAYMTIIDESETAIYDYSYLPTNSTYPVM